MSTGEDYYQILGIEKNSTPDQIKKAFRKKAMECHPDKHCNSPPDTQKLMETQFKTINEAYEVLQDERKRGIYNQFGKQGLQAANGPSAGHNPMEQIFAAFFGGGRGGGGPKRESSNKPPVVQKQIQVSLADLYLGRKDMSTFVKILVPCDSCTRVVCLKCKGAGKEVKLQQVGPGMMSQSLVSCNSCNGNGYTVTKTEDKKCSHPLCKGKGMFTEEVEIKFSIEAGMAHQEFVVCHNLGHHSPIFPNVRGDVAIGLLDKTESKDSVDDVAPTKFIRHPRMPNDLCFRKEISLLDSLIGFKFQFSHLDGKKLLFVSPKDHLFSNLEVAILKGHGMPIRSQEGKFGDLYIQFVIVMPKAVDFRTDANMNLLKTVFAKSPCLPVVKKRKPNMIVPEVTLQKETETEDQEEDDNDDNDHHDHSSHPFFNM